MRVDIPDVDPEEVRGQSHKDEPLHLIRYKTQDGDRGPGRKPLTPKQQAKRKANKTPLPDVPPEYIVRKHDTRSERSKPRIKKRAPRPAPLAPTREELDRDDRVARRLHREIFFRDTGSNRHGQIKRPKYTRKERWHLVRNVCIDLVSGGTRRCPVKGCGRYVFRHQDWVIVIPSHKHANNRGRYVNVGRLPTCEGCVKAGVIVEAKWVWVERRLVEITATEEVTRLVASKQDLAAYKRRLVLLESTDPGSTPLHRRCRSCGEESPIPPPKFIGPGGEEVGGCGRSWVVTDDFARCRRCANSC